MTLMRIRLELARSHEFPEGSARHGYDLVAPLRADGHIDRDAWAKQRTACAVRRFWGGEEDLSGHLVHIGSRWAFHYDSAAAPAPDEPGYRFDSHVFRPGEYVSITEGDGTLRTFKVASVNPVSDRSR
jgi:hypothetical protein